jgi:hypothetical protein
VQVPRNDNRKEIRLIKRIQEKKKQKRKHKCYWCAQHCFLLNDQEIKKNYYSAQVKESVIFDPKGYLNIQKN